MNQVVHEQVRGPAATDKRRRKDPLRGPRADPARLRGLAGRARQRRQHDLARRLGRGELRARGQRPGPDPGRRSAPATGASAWPSALGMCLWALGDFAMTYESIHNANPPTPVLANYLWAAFFPLAYVGVMLLMRQEVRKFTAANYLDGVVATLTCAAAFAAFAFGTIQKAAGGDAVTVAWNLIYPVGDILLLILTLAAATLLPAGRRRTRWYLMAAASLCNAIGDVCAPVRQRHRRHPLRLLLELRRPGRPRCFCSRCRSGCPRGRPRASSRRPARAS